MALNVFVGHTICFSGKLSMEHKKLEALVNTFGGACGEAILLFFRVMC